MPNRSVLRSYALAIGSVAGAALATQSTPAIAQHSPYILVIGAVVISALVLERPPAIASAAAAVIVGAGMRLQDGWPPDLPDLIDIGTLATVAFMLATLVSGRRMQMRALATSEARYRTLVEVLPEAVLIQSAGRWEFANPGAVHLFGAKDPSDLIGRPIVESIPPAERQEVRERIARAASGPTPLREAQVIRFDGGTTDIEVMGVALAPDSDRRMVVMRDIGARKTAERERAETTAMLRGVIDASPLPILAIDRETTVRLWNRAAERVFGWRADEIIGRPVPFVPADRAAEFQSNLDAVIAGKEMASFDTRRRRKDGPLVEVTVATAPILLPRDRGNMAVAVLTDNTERNARDRELCVVQERYRSLFEHMQEGSALHELVMDGERPVDYRILDVNATYEQLTGIVRADAVGRLASELYGTGEPPFLDVYAKAALTGEAAVFERHFAPMQKTFVIAAFGIGPNRFATTFQDVTAHRNLEEEFQHAQRMEAIGRLAGGVAHDFNNLLTAILGFADMAIDALPESDPVRADVEQIKRAGERAVSMTRQLLAFSRKQVLQPVVLELNEHLYGSKRFLERALGEDIRIVLDLGREPLEIFADPSQIDQVLLNLTVNARDAMPNGGILTIQVAGSRIGDDHLNLEPGDYVRLAVTDTGVGISDEVKSRLFEPFFTTKPVGKGTGLGLASVYGIVRQSGGAIDVKSKPGEGATFTVYLPITTRGPASAPAPRIPASRLTSGSATLLIVDDDAAVADLARRVLARHGHHILVALNPGKAVEIATQHAGAIDLLVTDVVMPTINGVELAQRLRESQPNMRVLYMSGYAEGDVIERAASDAGARFLEKPFAADTLMQAVRDILGPTAPIC